MPVGAVVSVPSVLLRHFLFPVHHEQTIVDASARSLNIEKLAHTLDTNGDGKLFT